MSSVISNTTLIYRPGCTNPLIIITSENQQNNNVEPKTVALLEPISDDVTTPGSDGVSNTIIPSPLPSFVSDPVAYLQATSSYLYSCLPSASSVASFMGGATRVVVPILIISLREYLLHKQMAQLSPQAQTIAHLQRACPSEKERKKQADFHKQVVSFGSVVGNTVEKTILRFSIYNQINRNDIGTSSQKQSEDHSKSVQLRISHANLVTNVSDASHLRHCCLCANDICDIVPYCLYVVIPCHSVTEHILCPQCMVDYVTYQRNHNAELNCSICRGEFFCSRNVVLEVRKIS